MKRFLHLVKGELVRLVKYKIIFFGILVSFIWVLIIYFTDEQTAISLAPSLVLMDAGLMSIILLGSGYFLEKQEGTLHAMLVSPMKLSWILAAKVISAIVVALISLFIVVGSVLIIYGNVLHFLPMLFYMIIVVLAHTSIGYWMALHANDFMQMLVRYMGLALLLVSPILFMGLGMIPSGLEFIVYLSPSYAGQTLFESTFKEVDTWRMLLSFAVLVILPLVVYPVFVYKQFCKVAVEG